MDICTMDMDKGIWEVGYGGTCSDHYIMGLKMDDGIMGGEFGVCKSWLSTW
jgi:hypothetical protein